MENNLEQTANTGKRILLVEDKLTSMSGLGVACRSMCQREDYDGYESVTKESCDQYVGREFVEKNLASFAQKVREGLAVEIGSAGENQQTKEALANLSSYDIFLNPEGRMRVPYMSDGKITYGSFTVPRELEKGHDALSGLVVKKVADSYFGMKSNDKVTIVSDIENALSLIESGQVDLVVTDLGLDTPESVKYSKAQGHGTKTALEFRNRNKERQLTRRAPWGGDCTVLGSDIGQTLDDFDKTSNGILVARGAMNRGVPHFIYTSSDHFGDGVMACYLNSLLSESTFMQEVVAGRKSLDQRLYNQKQPDGINPSPKVVLEDTVCIGGKDALIDFLSTIDLAKKLKLKRE